jgi:ribulose-5-phosphate 4-epimerase/fuculose-1-phosphate aldolase
MAGIAEQWHIPTTVQGVLAARIDRLPVAEKDLLQTLAVIGKEVRDPEDLSLYWTNPMAVHFSQVKVSNLICADHQGIVVEGKYAINRAGFVLHAAVHEQHQDIVAMCHAHTTYGIAFASLGRPLAPIWQDAAAFFEDHVVIGDEAGKFRSK